MEKFFLGTKKKTLRNCQVFVTTKFDINMFKYISCIVKCLGVDDHFYISCVFEIGKFDIARLACTIKSGWSIVYIKGLWVKISKIMIVFLSPKINFVLAKSADPDELPHYEVFHLGLHYLPFRSAKG